MEGIDIRVRDVVHAIGLVGPGIVLQELRVLPVELGRAALQGIAAVVGRQGPICVLGGLRLVKCVVARPVGAQVAKGLVDKA